MSARRNHLTAAFTALIICGLISSLPPAFAQNQPGNGNGNGNQNGQNGQNGQQQPAAGIIIDAQGLVRTITARDGSRRQMQQRIEAALEQLSDDLHEASGLRKISLVRLEAACRETLQAGEELPDDLKYLAGLQRIDYLFVDPEENDILIAGPAEPFVPDALGRMVGLGSGRPPLRLDDLVVALRAAAQGDTIGCSIDPVPQRLTALQQYLRRNSFPASTAVAKARYSRMARVLGNQTVRLWGVPEDSHYAHVLTEADLRMKRLSMGLDKAGVRGFRSYLAMLTPKGNSMQRWWFVPYYDTFEVSEDGHAFHFAGQRAKLMAQEEVVDGSGFRTDAAFTRNSTQLFARQFTEKFPELAGRFSAFAELQNLIDLAVVSALIRERGLADQIGWNMAFFLNPQQMPLESFAIPKEVRAAANYKMANRRLVIGLVGGGVVVNPRQTVRQLNFQPSEGKQLDRLQTEVVAEKASPDHAWWRN